MDSRQRPLIGSGARPLRRLLVSLASICALAAVALSVHFDGNSQASATNSTASPANDVSDDPSSIDAQLDELPPRYSDCDSAKLTRPFALWGDNAEYAEVENGSFDAGLTGWEITGKPAEVTRTLTDRVLQVSGGTQILSPPICFDETRPHAKMNTRILLGLYTTGRVEVEVHYDSLADGPEEISVGEFNQNRSSAIVWKPSPELGTGLGGTRKLAQPDENGHRWFRFEFAVHGKAVWQIDDLFVDPRRRN